MSESNHGAPERAEPRHGADAGRERAPDADRTIDGGAAPPADALDARDAPAADPVSRATERAERGDVSAAIKMLREHLVTSSRDLRARELLSRLLERRGDVAGAAVEVTRALEAQPESVLLLCRRAALLIAHQQFDRAELDLRRAAKLDTASSDVQLTLGMLHCKRARWREAIAPLEQAVDLDPSRVSGHYFLAEAYNQTDRLQEALAQYETVVHLEPGNWRALKGVGIVLDKMGRPAEATLAYKKAREVQRR